MAGGRGTRLDSDREKPLYRVAGRPMIDHVLDALVTSAVDSVLVATTPNTPETQAHVSVPTVETPGDGYVEDLDDVLSSERVSDPVLTVAADLPLLSRNVVDEVLDAHETGSLTVTVPASLKRDLGVSVDTTFEHGGRTVAPSGVNVVADGPSSILVRTDPELAVNVNRPPDAAVAHERLSR